MISMGTSRACMNKSMVSYENFNWWLPLYAAVGTAIGYLPVTMLPYDIGWLLYAFVVTPLVWISLVAFSMRNVGRRRLAVLSMLGVYGVLSWAILRNYLEARSDARWLLHSRTYKAEALAQPSPQNGELRHMEWDGWGMAGQDTVVYLVNDPNDSLLPATRGYSAGNSKGISCDVWRVSRLESHWYSVVFYTDTAWDDC
jgi:hypothetical protein